MQKIEPNSPEAQSANIVADNIAKLRDMFPELVTETEGVAAINVDVLKALVGDATAYDGDEKYGLNWHGKRKARQIALLIRPYEVLSRIANLKVLEVAHDALRVLLQHRHVLVGRLT